MSKLLSCHSEKTFLVEKTLKHLSDKPGIIYVSLLDEGTDCWRPVAAVQTKKHVYRIINEPIDGERWQFESGDFVRCREGLSAENEPFLEAFELASLL